MSITIDKAIIKDIQDLLINYRRNIEDEMIKVEKFRLWGGIIEFIEKNGEDPIEFHILDILPKNKVDRKQCLEMLKDFCEDELKEIS